MAQRSWVGHLVGFGDPNFKVLMVGGGGGLYIDSCITIHSNTDEPTSALSLNTETLNEQAYSSMFHDHRPP